MAEGQPDFAYTSPRWMQSGCGEGSGGAVLCTCNSNGSCRSCSGRSGDGLGGGVGDIGGGGIAASWRGGDQSVAILKEGGGFFGDGEWIQTAEVYYYTGEGTEMEGPLS